jgi:dolichyl-phosphate beta-glucosyltransferase
LDGAAGSIEEAEVLISVVIPAYNEEERLEGMLVEAVEYLDSEFGRPSKNASGKIENGQTTGSAATANGKVHTKRGAKTNEVNIGPSGYEIILIDDGSKDKTVDVALCFSQKHQLHDTMRIVRLKENRGKGGAVTHGFRHVRGEYAIFADADGASTFSDLGKLIEGCKEVHDRPRRGIAVGSRAHMVGTEAVVKVRLLLPSRYEITEGSYLRPSQRSVLRNILMHSFHLLLRIMTPPATSQIRDTQCGFKLFSRASLPYIIPYMHAEGWIFDVEMLMLAESAPAVKAADAGPGIKVKEVPIGWKEVGGSKLNVMWDSLGMAWSLFLLRASWVLGFYRRW